MHPSILTLLALLAAYLLGSIPNGLLVARLKGIDIRKVGSGNIGATNVFRSVGKFWGILTFICDALKGLIPAWLFPQLAGEPGAALGIFCGALAIAGHNWPIFLKFKGGKGVATSAGVLLGIAPAAVGIGLLSWLILFLSTRYVSVASIGAALVVPLAGWFLYRDGLLLPITLTVLGLVTIVRHQANLRRLIAGTEHRFEFGKKTPTEHTEKHG